VFLYCLCTFIGHGCIFLCIVGRTLHVFMRSVYVHLWFWCSMFSITSCGLIQLFKWRWRSCAVLCHLDCWVVTDGSDELVVLAVVKVPYLLLAIKQLISYSSKITQSLHLHYLTHTPLLLDCQHQSFNSFVCRCLAFPLKSSLYPAVLRNKVDNEI
jgi:hypothetical protein